jgi:hypothetical protein
MEENIIEDKAEQGLSRPAPTGVDILHTLLARMSGLEARMTEVERCKHTEHQIPPETVNVLKELMRVYLVELLTPKTAEVEPIKEAP